MGDSWVCPNCLRGFDGLSLNRRLTFCVFRSIVLFMTNIRQRRDRGSHELASLDSEAGE